jgi:hypothetical protein
MLAISHQEHLFLLLLLLLLLLLPHRNRIHPGLLDLYRLKRLLMILPSWDSAERK